MSLMSLICSDQSFCVLLQVLSIDFLVALCVALILTAGIDVLGCYPVSLTTSGPRETEIDSSRC